MSETSGAHAEEHTKQRAQVLPPGGPKAGGEGEGEEVGGNYDNESRSGNTRHRPSEPTGIPGSLGVGVVLVGAERGWEEEEEEGGRGEESTT